MVLADESQTVSEGHLRLRAQVWRRAVEGYGPGAIAISLEDPLEFAAAIFGCWLAGRSVVLPADLLPGTVSRVEPLVAGWIVDTPVNLEGARMVSGVSTAPSANGPQEWMLGPEETALCLFTSGSSGDPRPVGKCLRQLEEEISALETVFGTAERVSVVGTVSHQHIYGLLFRVLWPLCAGRPILRWRIRYPEELPKALGRQACWLVSTPSHLSRLNGAHDWLPARAMLRRVFSSAGPLQEEGASLARDVLGIPVCEILGSTETGGIAWRMRDSADRPWVPLPGVEWRVEAGMLVVRSPFLHRRGDWWTSSDRVEAVHGGFRHVGRGDRIVKIEGMRVSLRAIERALATVPGVKDVHVACPIDLGQRTAALVELGEDAKLPVSEAQRRRWIVRLQAALAGAVDRVAWPRRWRFVNAVPRDAQGKVSRRIVERMLASRTPRVQWSATGPTELVGCFRLGGDQEWFQGHFPGAPVLPGVAMLHWVGTWARDRFGLRGSFRAIEQLKFHRLIRPGLEARVRVVLQGAGTSVAFELTSAEGVHASGRLRFDAGAGA
ncbi:MAG: AMP-binding protein [Lysobacteraceae bacterium]|nr:MAG: AMP-binding protein [Xanthomonadaceae bacterium]